MKKYNEFVLINEARDINGNELNVGDRVKYYYKDTNFKKANGKKATITHVFDTDVELEFDDDVDAHGINGNKFSTFSKKSCTLIKKFVEEEPTDKYEDWDDINESIIDISGDELSIGDKVRCINPPINHEFLNTKDVFEIIDIEGDYLTVRNDNGDTDDGWGGYRFQLVYKPPIETDPYEDWDDVNEKYIDPEFFNDVQLKFHIGDLVKDAETEYEVVNIVYSINSNSLYYLLHDIKGRWSSTITPYAITNNKSMFGGYYLYKQDLRNDIYCTWSDEDGSNLELVNSLGTDQYEDWDE